MPPKSWKACPHCGQLFSPSSLAMHEKRCNQREDVRAEHELRELEGFARPPPVADWPRCPNCGEQYGSHAIGPHVKRCRRLRPYGANGFGPGGGPPETEKDLKSTLGAEPFQGLWGIGDVSELIRQLREKTGITKDSPMDAVRALFNRWDVDGNGRITRAEMTQVLKELTDFSQEQIDALYDAADTDKDGAINYEEFLDFLWDPSTKKLSLEELEALRALFNRFDADQNGVLKPSEFTNLMQNMLPTRAGEFDVADIDSDGGISFDEFVKYWQSVVGKPGFLASELDEVADMFNCFDKNSSGELERAEFLNLLDNLFPGRCEENRKHVDDEFAACDASHTNGVSFAELLAYYERLKSWYGEKNGWPPLDSEEREECLAADFVKSRCGLKFLPDRLPVHHRSCEVCKKIVADEQAEEARRRAEEEKEALRKAQEEENERLKRAQEEEEARRRAEEEARKKIAEEQDEEARRRAQEEARMKEALRKAREEKNERLRRAQEEEEARRRAEEEARRKAEEAKKDPNGFVPCRYCGRTFFPDRVPKHEAVCPKKGSIHGIRPTMTPGEMAPTIGQYNIPR